MAAVPISWSISWDMASSEVPICTTKRVASKDTMPCHCVDKVARFWFSSSSWLTLALRFCK